MSHAPINWRRELDTGKGNAVTFISPRLISGLMPFPIGCGKTISQPFTVALMTDLLELNEDDRVLEVGTGLGYQVTYVS